MDVLTDWLRATKAGGEPLARVQMVPPWGLHFAAKDAAGLHIVVEGNCWLRRNEHEPLRLRQGDLAMVPRPLKYALVDQPESAAESLEQHLARSALRPTGARHTIIVCGAYRFEQDFARPRLRTLPPVVHLPVQHVRANPSLWDTLSLLLAEIERPVQGSDTLIERLFDALFVYLLREWAARADAAEPGWLSALRDETLARVLARMHAEPGAAWTVESLAREAGTSRATLARRFMQKMGEPPLTYLTRWRMGFAARLLLETDASLADVAGRVGYESEFAFSRAFKRSRGVAPIIYRRMARKGRLPEDGGVAAH